MWKGDTYWQFKENAARKRTLYLVGGVIAIVGVFWVILHVSGGLEKGAGDGGPPTAFATRGANTWEEIRREAAGQDDKAFTALVVKHCSDACRKRTVSACADVCKEPKDYIHIHISAASLKSPPIPKECRRSCELTWPQACDAGCRAPAGDSGLAACLGLRNNCDKPCGAEQQKHRNRPLEMRRVFIQSCSHGCKAGIKWSCGIAAEDRAKRIAMNKH